MILEGLCFYFNKLHFYLQIPIICVLGFLSDESWFQCVGALCTAQAHCTRSHVREHDMQSVYLCESLQHSDCVVTAAMSFSYVCIKLEQFQYVYNKCNTSFECIRSGRENHRSRTCLFIYIGNLCSYILI